MVKVWDGLSAGPQVIQHRTLPELRPAAATKTHLLLSVSRQSDQLQPRLSLSAQTLGAHLEYTWTCVMSGGNQVKLQEEQRRSSLPSLTQSVQVNRSVLRHLLTNQRTPLDDSQSESREHDTARLPRQQQREDRARMKRRCVPLRGDHNLLTPDTHTLSGVRLHPVIQVRLGGVASHSGHLSNSSSGESAPGSTRRRPAVSPTRRLRFEDETELEVESRYLERQQQRRRVGQRGTGVLVSKPDLNMYINRRAEAGLQGERYDVDKQQRGRTPAGGRGLGQCDSCGTVLGGRVNLNHRLHQPVLDDRGQSLYRPHLNLRTEPIRETYIGSVTLGETRYAQGGGGTWRVSDMQVRRSSTNQVELNVSQAMPSTDLPINPYGPDPLTTPAFRCPSPPTATSAMTPQSSRLKSTKAGRDLDEEEPGRPAVAQTHRDVQCGSELKDRSCLDEDPRMKNSSSSSSGTKAESQGPASSESSADGQFKQPIGAELHSDVASFSKSLSSRDESPRLSLHRLFSTVRLGRTRTGSLDRIHNRPHPPALGPAPSGQIKKCLSVQSLNVGSPFLQLRKLSSVQSFGSEQKKNRDRSADYRPVADRFLQRCLSVEDIGSPCSLRSVGRVLEVGSDGTFLLGLSRPRNRTYGFIISRGRGRLDSGVYVEDMVDNSTEKLYAGLLSVGDEILEVNGEKVACLSLDQVTQLLTQNASTTVRVLRHLRTIPQ
ncbi:uncharacterized protein si:dkey-121a11.3 [Toxotes jaculatrix]|uniref:uncharacterized protein si:dkey-121a11.3 n=1 Tax=Toxotes jaculatrix TaxID=941984 RepID=UPI001B3AE1C7|nr:uncharacterized protein si:dkey-121a11.3 [Toxotes jaculatrix]